MSTFNDWLLAKYNISGAVCEDSGSMVCPVSPISKRQHQGGSEAQGKQREVHNKQITEGVDSTNSLPLSVSSFKVQVMILMYLSHLGNNNKDQRSEQDHHNSCNDTQMGGEKCFAQMLCFTLGCTHFVFIIVELMGYGI